MACDSKEIIAESGNDDEILVTSSVDNTSNSSNTTTNEANSSNNLELIKSYFNNFQTYRLLAIMTIFSSVLIAGQIILWGLNYFMAGTSPNSSKLYR